MTFGGYLEKCIKSKDISIAGIAKICDINRGGLYNIFAGARPLSEEKLFELIDNIDFTNDEKATLTDLYYKELYGESDFADIKEILRLLQTDFYTADKVEFAPFAPHKVLDKSEVQSAIAYIIGNDNNFITNYEYSKNELDYVIYNSIIKCSDKKFSHIISYNKNDSESYNVKTIFSSLKYMYNGIFPLLISTDKNISENILYPYYFVGEKCAVIFNDNNGIFTDDKNIVAQIFANAKSVADKAQPFGTNQMDIMDMKNLYNSINKQEEKSTQKEICFYPCLAKYADIDFIFDVAKDVPQKEALVNIAYNHYQSAFGKCNYIQIVTLKGIEMFADSGYVQEIPENLVGAASIEKRIGVLEKLIGAVNDDELYILDSDKISLEIGTEIEVGFDKLMIFGYDRKKENFSAADNFVFTETDKTIIKPFENFFDYLIRARFVYPKDYSVKLIKNQIVKLEHMK